MQIRWNYWNYWNCGARRLAAGLCCLLTAQLVAGPAQAEELPKQLNIVVVQGEGAVNNIRQRATDPVVKVEDENHKPITEAVVVFTLPTEGATGEFVNHSKSLTVMTDSRGEAVAKGLKTNQFAGKLPIHISASYHGLTARTNMMQFSVVPAGQKEGGGGGNGKLILILVAIGGAAAGGAAFALHKGGSSPTPGTPAIVAPIPIGLTPGSGTISAPPH
jgi:hypothetical protein